MIEGLYQSEYWLSTFIIQRGLGFIYAIAFLVAINQFRPLLGENGLLPVPRFVNRIPFKRSPSIFHWHYSDRFFSLIAWAGFTLSLLAAFGISDVGPLWLSMLIWFFLWVLYLSIVNVGQLFYGFGWESLLLEAGFYAIFLGPIQYESSIIMVFILRWLVFRVEFGAGLIKMRGDECWSNLTCLNYHHETQPMPNPLSRFFHLLPEKIHKFETLCNHIVQLGAVWLLFLPQPFATIGALLIILSQLYLIISGNYAWLNWLTLLLAFSGISNQYLAFLMPVSLPPELYDSFILEIISMIVGIIVAYLSIGPIKNLISPQQRMNASFNPLHLVNTYGAFGSVTRTRYEIVIEGTTDHQLDTKTTWKAYEFKGKPGNPKQIPSQWAPYHLRLDWQIWFAAMTSIRSNTWLLKFIYKLLKADKDILKLLSNNPFNNKSPNYIRVRLFQYQFTSQKEYKETGNWWRRSFERIYLPPQSTDDLQHFSN
ncbi:lipase maturation factor family protein [Fodinibius sp. AD559]|uniref:lipase maturation factor family protein n=1 Tax=Fodinibius sp. AD559 TaxID=3424179 RepID=UPI004046D846